VPNKKKADRIAIRTFLSCFSRRILEKQENNMNAFKSLTVGTHFKGGKNKGIIDLFSGKLKLLLKLLL
jgi:hypothetical protein